MKPNCKYKRLSVDEIQLQELYGSYLASQLLRHDHCHQNSHMQLARRFQQKSLIKLQLQQQQQHATSVGWSHRRTKFLISVKTSYIATCAIIIVFAAIKLDSQLYVLCWLAPQEIIAIPVKTAEHDHTTSLHLYCCNIASYILFGHSQQWSCTQYLCNTQTHTCQQHASVSQLLQHHFTLCLARI